MPKRLMPKATGAIFAATAIALCIPTAHAADQDIAADGVRSQNVQWNELGQSSADSMPIGNGDIGLNVWTEQNGDICFYVGKTDAWSEENTGPWGLLKLGRIRLTLTPNPFTGDAHVQQTLQPYDGTMTIVGTAADRTTTVRLWVDANQPVVRVECDSAAPVAVKVAYESWRTTKQGWISADVTVPSTGDSVMWYHHNAKAADPHLQDYTFGGALAGPGLVHADSTTLRSTRDVTHQLISVYALTAHPSTPEEWQSQLNSVIQQTDSVDIDQAREQSEQWWHNFWHRSWIFVSGDSSAATTTRGYVLQRFVTACAGRGAGPIKFNGSIFVVDNPQFDDGKDKTTGKEKIIAVTADYRRWGGQYWFQNTRAMYWPRLMAGDFDILMPLFRIYQNLLPYDAELVHKYYGHAGAYFAETAPLYGGLKHLTDATNRYTDHYFTPILELSTMMLDYFDYTQDRAFLRDTALPIANQGLTFFDQHFARDDQGKLLLDPDNSIETYWMAHDPAPDIAGLHYVIQRLQSLPPDLTTSDQRALWSKLQGELPDLPIGERHGNKVLLPYTGPQTMKMSNGENPELYAVYPFRIYGLGKPDLQMARDTFDVRRVKSTGCWIQDPIQAAYLGMATLAQEDTAIDFTRQDHRLKFPAFWEPSHDYEPDEDNGGNGENSLQKMLMQCDGKQIRILPAWPKNWDADFKLDAPYQTTVQASVRGGKLIDLQVSPAERRGDVILPN